MLGVIHRLQRIHSCHLEIYLTGNALTEQEGWRDEDATCLRQELTDYASLVECSFECCGGELVSRASCQKIFCVTKWEISENYCFEGLLWCTIKWLWEIRPGLLLFCLHHFKWRWIFFTIAKSPQDILSSYLYLCFNFSIFAFAFVASLVRWHPCQFTGWILTPWAWRYGLAFNLISKG